MSQKLTERQRTFINRSHPIAKTVTESNLSMVVYFSRRTLFRGMVICENSNILINMPSSDIDSNEELQCSLRRFKADVFQVLANPTRIHIIECLREGEWPVKSIQEQLGVEASNTSQHLAILRAKGLVVTRKEGNQVFYSLRDPLLTEVLDAMRKYFRSHLEASLAMLEGMEG